MMQFRNSKKIFLTLAAITIVALSSSLTFAQSDPATADQKAALQQQLNDIENQITQLQGQLSQIQGQKKTLQNKILQLQKQQASLNLQIQATNLQLTDINNQLAETEAQIVINEAKIAQLKSEVKSYISALYQQDGYSLLDVLLSQDNLSDFLTEAESYTQLSDQLHAILTTTAETNDQLAGYKTDLSAQQDQANHLLAIQSLQQDQLKSSVSEQSTLLSQTKGKEANYQAIISTTTAQANEIRSRLYQLLGVSSQITFGQAVEVAQWASGQTGVRAAFLLAILTQESNLGKNVGTCNRPGDPPSKSYKVIMKPDRDIPPFLQITSELGMDPNVTPVSCPMHDSKGNQIGWGGAMGPAQFIPSTWMGYKDQVAAMTGKPANPWDIRDAFLAAAVKLKSGGAGTVDGEWAAAMRYFSGGTNLRYRFYGDNVVNLAAQYQADIDNLGK